ncbi:hypothetical protein CYMTET_44822 [Cymbomonas tetramitiformis]|uniref:Uncharacterized protein n=1 Tax=Cymbomonas tetramitiformis TaxID=36881 RepID=A0AAE0EZ72_9CHLO|nr:hypothetical protein CYMTET_44822 [Cymbomonas tetramitiformis]
MRISGRKLLSARCSSPASDSTPSPKGPACLKGRRNALGLIAAAVSAQRVAPAEASVFTGKYFDSNHPGCPRNIDSNGVLEGLDPDPFVPGQGYGQEEGAPGTCYAQGTKSGGSGKPTVPWKIQTIISDDDKTIFIDFDQKDGSGCSALFKKYFCPCNEEVEPERATLDVGKKIRPSPQGLRPTSRDGQSRGYFPDSWEYVNSLDDILSF